MQRKLANILVLACVPLAAQETHPGSETRREIEDIKKDCKSLKTAFGCAQIAFTAKPVHLTAGTLAPGNGVGFGPAFVFENATTNWRLNWNADAAGTANGSWRSGAYLKAMYSGGIKKLRPNEQASRPPKGQEQTLEGNKPVPEINLYVQGISLKKLSYYGEGQFTSRQNLALFGLRQTVLGGNGIYPLGDTGLSAFAEVNGRVLDPSGRHGDSSVPSVPSGLLHPLNYLQVGEGLRLVKDLGSMFDLQYLATLQQWASITDSHYTFQRFILDADTQYLLYRKQLTHVTGTGSTGPAQSAQPATPPQGQRFTRNREGSIGLRILFSKSIIPEGNQQPFYLQPTIGGGDINGQNWLGSYPDYRFRAPNLLVFRGSLEHSIWGPVGGIALADFGRAATDHSDQGWDHFRHSFGVGLTLRAGGLPAVSILFAFGGGEGTHTIALVSPTLFGSNSRPPVF